MYISSVSLNLNRKLLLAGMMSVCIFSGCTIVRQPVQPYRDRSALPETAQPEQESGMSQQGRSSAAPPFSSYQSSDASSIESQQPYSEEQLAYTKEILEPIRATVRSRGSFYAQQVKSWQALEQTSFHYRTPEQSETLFSCQSRVSELHDAYTELQIQLFNFLYRSDLREKSIANFELLQNKDFSYLEGECPILFKQLSAEHEGIVAPEAPGRPAAPAPPADNGIFQPGRPEFDNSPESGIGYEQTADGPEVDILSFTEPSPDYAARYQHAQALLKQGEEEEARHILSDLLANIRQTGSNRALQITILKKISELEFALRNYLAARIHYEELQQLNATFDKQHLNALQSVDSQREKVDAYAALLMSSMTSDPEQDGFTVVQQARSFIQSYPDSPLRSEAEELEAKAEQEAEHWFRQLQQQVDQLAANQQYQDALALLDKVPLDILPLDKQDIIQRKKNVLINPLPAQTVPPLPPPVAAEKAADIDIAMPVAPPPRKEQDMPAKAKKKSQPERSVQQKTRYAQDSGKKTSAPASSGPIEKTALQDKWDKAEDAFQSANYDKAIGLFSDLLHTSLGVKARNKVEKASRSAGQEARRKAANFFQRANSATDPEVRKQHLLSSKTILEDILKKYPLAGLDAKVQRNLSRVNKELTALADIPFE